MAFTGKRIFGIGLDGVPHSFAQQLMDEGRWPNIKALAEQGTFKRINSVFPPVSNVAWTSFQTGLNPGGFDVYGFVDLKPNMEMYLPRSNDVKAPTIWHKMSERGMHVIALSLPQTWPAFKVNGILVSGFLSPPLDEQAVSSPELVEKLKKTGYIIDIDPKLAHDDLNQFEDYLYDILDGRRKTALSLMKNDPWDYFFLHVMDTDRINHFVWSYQHDPSSPHCKRLFDFYTRVDEVVGELASALPDDAELIIMSDHGFCDLEWEVQVNRWLRKKGYLNYEMAPAKHFEAVQAGSKAVALVPGRVHILTKDKWSVGAVGKSDYDSVRNDLIAELGEWRDPRTGLPICKKVLTREEVYTGPYAQNASDIVIDSRDGYDLKATLGTGEFFTHGPIVGMHTFWDAMLILSPGLKHFADSTNVTEVGANVWHHYLG